MGVAAQGAAIVLEATRLTLVQVRGTARATPAPLLAPQTQSAPSSGAPPPGPCRVTLPCNPLPAPHRPRPPSETRSCCRAPTSG
jgi:hypothetical protein